MKNNSIFTWTCLLSCLITSVSATVSCPFGITDDAYPGLCKRYVDKDNNSICDLSEDSAAEPANCDLTVSCVPLNSGTISINPQKEAYAVGESVELTATAATGFAFANWTGQTSGTQSKVTVTLDESFNAVANFTESQTGDTTTPDSQPEPTPVEMICAVYPATSGTVTSDLSFKGRVVGDSITLTATTNGTKPFQGWTGDIQSTENPLTIELTKDLFLVALFSDPNEINADGIVVQATVWPNNAGAIQSATPLVDLPANTTTSLTAEPKPGYTFKQWVGDVRSGDNPLTLNVTKNTQVVAEFTAVTVPLFQAIDLGDGWFESAWYGKIKTEFLPQILHENAGWQYIVSEESNGLYLYDHGLEKMLWTSEAYYPYLYLSGENPGWVWYSVDTKTPNRWYYDFRTETFVTEDDLKKN